MADTLCRRCLLRESMPADYEKYVASLVQTIPARQRAAQALVDERLRCCKACEHLDRGTCMGCGCLVELRAAYRAPACPFERWPS